MPGSKEAGPLRRSSRRTIPDENQMKEVKEEVKEPAAKPKRRKPNPGKENEVKKPKIATERNRTSEVVAGGWRPRLRDPNFARPDHRAALIHTSARRLLPQLHKTPMWLGPFQSYVERFAPVRIEGPCKSRLTALDWHPVVPELVAVGSKHGNVAVWDVRHPLDPRTIFPASDNTGPGAYTEALVFDKLRPDYVWSASMDRHIMRHHIHSRTSTAALSIPIENNYSNWWVSLDVSPLDGVVLAGDNKGTVVAVAPDSNHKVWELKLNKGKTHHVEFSRREPWLFCTASVDHVVRLWDLRALRSDSADRPLPLVHLQHQAAVNIASFSPSGSQRLMTSDQKDRITFYQGPMWQELGSVHHPHRQFQHLTPIRTWMKASWHPMVDVVVIGRYPAKEDPAPVRALDFFAPDLLPPPSEEGSSVKPFLSLLPRSPSANLTSISKFNATGEYLATAAGYAAIIWARGREPDLGADTGASGHPSPPTEDKKKPRKKRTKKEASLDS